MIADMDPFVQQLIQSALVVLIPMLLTGLAAFGGLLWQQLRAYLKAKVSERAWLLIDALGSTAVRATEQTLSLITPEAKKAFAVSMFDMLLAQWKITLPEELKGRLIEGVLAKEKLVGLDYIRDRAAQQQAQTMPPQGSTAAFTPANGGNTVH